MKLLATITGSLLLTSATCFAESNPHNLSIKPTYSHTSGMFSFPDHGGNNQLYEMTPHNNFGVEMQYFYLKPQGIFFDSTFSWSMTDDLSPLFSTNKSRSSTIKNEVKLGNTWTVGNALVSPYALVSFLRNDYFYEEWNGNTETHHSYHGTTGIGVRFNTSLTDEWKLSVDGNGYIFPRYFGRYHHWGYKITVPVSYEKNDWSYAVSPFFAQSRSSHSIGRSVSNTLGTSLQAQYSF